MNSFYEKNFSFLDKKIFLTILIVFFSFFLRLIFLYFSDGFTRPVIEDSADYHNHALNIIYEGEHYVFNQEGNKIFSSRPPLLSYVLSVAYLFPFDNKVLIGRILQIIFSSFTVFLSFLVSRKFGLNLKVSFLAMFIICCYPPSIFYSSRILTENLSAMLLLLSMLFFLDYFSKKNIFYLILAALFLTLLTLTRSSYLLLPFFLIFIFLLLGAINKRKLFKKYHISLFIIFSIIFLSPWTYRNYLIHEEIMPTTSRLGYMLYLSNNSLENSEILKGGYSREGSLFKDEVFLNYSELKKNEIYLEAAISEIVSKPKFFFFAAYQRIENTLTWRPNPIARTTWVSSDYIMFIIWLPILIFFSFSIIYLNKIPFLISWIFLSYILGISMFFWGIPRLRYPVDPIMIISAFTFINFYYLNIKNKFFVNRNE
tara:strand:- start:23953 stop:25233 length:1281 start_codon:yes stop_codon:yes gene_type:complete